MKPIWAGLALTLTVLAACEDAGGLSGSGDNPYAPGTDPSGTSVDALTVGHRLMDAGEYELALDEYYRAALENGLTVDVMTSIGSANLALGRLGQAEDILRKATEIDKTYPPAWNNLGVVLMEKDKYAEAANVFRRAFALDSGESAEIRDNLSLALAKLENPEYSEPDTEFALVRRGGGDYVLESTP